MNSNIMLGSLTIGGWGARRKNKSIAAKAEDEHKAKNGTVSATVHLLANVPEFKRISDTATMIRTAWTAVSLPWFDGKGGHRAVAADGVWQAKVKMGDWEREYFAVVDTFCEAYPSLLASRQFEMGDLFNPAQFPHPKDMRRRFYFIPDWMALPDAKDIRIANGLSPEEVKQMQEEAAARAEERFKRAMDTAAQRLFKVVNAMHTTMAVPIGEKGAKFNNTKLENIIDLVEIMPMLNLANDPKLAELTKQAKKLATKSPDELREDAVKRAAAAEEAKKLASRLADAFDVTGEDEEDE